MSNENLREKLARLQKFCLLAGGIMTFVLLLTAFYKPDLAADKVLVERPDAHLHHDKDHQQDGGHDGGTHHGDEKDQADPHGDHGGADERKNEDDEAHADTKAAASNTVDTASNTVEQAVGAASNVVAEATNTAHAAIDEPATNTAHGAAGTNAHGAAKAAAKDHGKDTATEDKRNIISRPFQTAWLIGWLYILAPTLGSFALLCIVHLTTGGWGWVIRRILEASMKTIVPVAILFLPILVPIVLHEHYKGSDGPVTQVTNYDDWLDAPEASADPHSITAKKSAFLDYHFFLLRQVLYFACWIVFILCMHKWSARQDETGDLRWRKKMKFFAGPFLLVHALVMSFAAFDWGMSIEPEWFSSIYGVIHLIGQGLSTFAFTLIVVSALAQHSPVKEHLSADRLHNIGNLQFAFVILWTYMNLAQFIIIWSANLPEEITYYHNRASVEYSPLTWFLFLFQFLVPFLILLSRHTKRATFTISMIAAWILFMRVVDINWMILPSVYPTEGAVILGRAAPQLTGLQVVLSVFAPVALGTLWLGFFLRNLLKLPLLPTKDPVFSPHFDYKEANS